MTLHDFMSRKFLALIFGFVLCIVLWVFAQHQGKRSVLKDEAVHPTFSGKEVDTSKDIPNGNTNIVDAEQHNDQQQAKEDKGGREAAIEKAEIQRWKDVAKDNVPIKFWGMVVDQDTNAVSGARVVMHVRHWGFDSNYGPTFGAIRKEVVTDANGRFEWIGADGVDLHVESVTKEGYRLSNNNEGRVVDYASSAPPGFGMPKPDATHPLIIQTWKLMPYEKLVTYSQPYRFEPDGRTYTIDLLKNKKFEGGGDLGGDIVVNFSRPKSIEPRQKYDWSMEMDVIYGGFSECTDEFCYLAPESGYQPSLQIQFKADDEKWADVITKDLYIRSRGGAVYGMLHLDIRAKYQDKSVIFFDVHLNPSGSRNLQPRDSE